MVKRIEYSTYGQGFVVNDQGEALAFLEQEMVTYGFQGRRLDAETGLMYFRNRYYSAERGRFLQRDPMGYKDSMGLYESFGGNPYSYSDPTGLLTRIIIVYHEPPNVILDEQGQRTFRHTPLTGTIAGDIISIAQDFQTQVRAAVSSGETDIEIIFTGHNASTVEETFIDDNGIETTISMSYSQMLMSAIMLLKTQPDSQQFRDDISVLNVHWFFWQACNTAWISYPSYYEEIFQTLQPNTIYVTGDLAAVGHGVALAGEVRPGIEVETRDDGTIVTHTRSLTVYEMKSDGRMRRNIKINRRDTRRQFPRSWFDGYYTINSYATIKIDELIKRIKTIGPFPCPD